MVKKIPRDHKGLYLSVPFTHGKQSNILNTHKGRGKCLKAQLPCKVFHDTNGKGETKMITKGFVKRTDFDKFTNAEAVAFVTFLFMEMERHLKDVDVIAEDIRHVREIHKI